MWTISDWTSVFGIEMAMSGTYADFGSGTFSFLFNGSFVVQWRSNHAAGILFISKDPKEWY
jgi:hypothetical protein